MPGRWKSWFPSLCPHMFFRTFFPPLECWMNECATVFIFSRLGPKPAVFPQYHQMLSNTWSYRDELCITFSSWKMWHFDPCTLEVKLPGSVRDVAYSKIKTRSSFHLCQNLKQKREMIWCTDTHPVVFYTMKVYKTMTVELKKGNQV